MSLCIYPTSVRGLEAYLSHVLLPNDKKNYSVFIQLKKNPILILPSFPQEETTIVNSFCCVWMLPMDSQQ